MSWLSRSRNFVSTSPAWKAGCIIRAVFLDDIMKVYKEEPNLPNLLLAKRFKEAFSQRQDSWRRVVKTALDNGIPTPAFSASLAYYDSYRRDRLPANVGVRVRADDLL